MNHYLSISPLNFEEENDLLIFTILSNDYSNKNVQKFLKNPNFINESNATMVEEKLFDILGDLIYLAKKEEDER